MNRERYLQEIDAVNAAGKYHPTWESLSTHPVPDWYREKRLGIFLHWGVFSVPAYHDWYARNMYIKGSPEYEYHCQHYGQPKDFGFKDFIPQFKMEAFDPQAWVKLFREAGADYIVPVAEHHDGFQNYRSELSHWNAAEMGPAPGHHGRFAGGGGACGHDAGRVEPSRGALVVPGAWAGV